MSLRDDLIAAKALIDTPEKWIKGSWEREGCYCAAGALRKALNAPMMPSGLVDWAFWNYPAVVALDQLTADGIANFNDAPRTTHADIMSLFDRAIASAQHEGHGETGESANG